MIGIETTSFIAVLGAAGLAIGLALQGSLANFAGGVLVLLFKPFRVGDFIDAQGVAGTVSEIQIFNTILTTPDNKKVIVHNSQITGGSITNFSAHDTRRVDMVFGIGYGDDIAEAKSILESLVHEHELVLNDPAPVVRLHELADSSVNFICRPWTKTGDYWAVYWDITHAVKESFDSNGISIPFPQQDMHVYHHGDAAPDALGKP